jgi:type II secretory pathway component GspD/PulD (secretin)
MVALAAIVGVTALAAAPAPDLPAKETAAERIKKALDQPVTLNHEGSSLDTILNDIRKQTKLPIVVDGFLIQNFGVSTDQVPASIKVEGVKARAALRTVLGRYQLDFAVVGDNLLISTESMLIQRQLKQRLPVDVSETPLAAALKQLGRDSGVNLLVDKRVAKEAQTPVSLQVDEAPLDAAIRLLVNQAGLKAVRLGNVIFVTSKANAAELQSDPPLAPAGVGEDFPVLPEIMPGGGIGPAGVLPNGAIPVPAPPPPAPAPRN